MTWLIIALVLVVAIGPVLYLLPSKKDKRLAALREQARSHGLHVRITSIAKLDPAGTERVNAAGQALEPKLACVSYARAVRANLQPFTDLILLKLPAQPTVPVKVAMSGWAMDNSPENGAVVGALDLLQEADISAALPSLLTDFPPDTVAVEMTNRHIACLWLERTEAESDVVSRIANTCQAIEKLLNDHIENGRGADG